MWTRSLSSLAAVFLVALPTRAVAAQGWSILPDGHPAWTDTYSTSGRFICGVPGGGGWPTGGSCDVIGNTLRLGNNGAFLTLEFIGRTQSLTTGPARQATTLGTLVTTVSGTGPFVFPAAPNPNALSFAFFLDIRNGAGLTQSRGFGYLLLRTPSSALPVGCCEDYQTYVSFDVPRPFGNFTYHSAQFNGFTDPRLLATNASIDITVTHGLVPEPSTYALTAAGLLGVLAAARRARRPRRG